MNVIEIKNGFKVYGEGSNKTIALNNINISIKKREFIAILGPSGSGKSTLLNIIGGLDKLTDGEVYICNNKCNKLNDEEMSQVRRRDIGFIFQAYNLIPVFTVYENIVTPIILDNGKINNDYIDSLLKILGIYDKKTMFPNQLSGGQKQRVAIARALANNPKIILADEPTGNLDTNNSKEVLNLLKEVIRKYNTTLIMVTHNENIAKDADRIIRIENGKILNISHN